VAPTGHAYRLVAWNHAWKVVEARTSYRANVRVEFYPRDTRLCVLDSALLRTNLQTYQDSCSTHEARPAIQSIPGPFMVRSGCRARDSTRGRTYSASMHELSYQVSSAQLRLACRKGSWRRTSPLPPSSHQNVFPESSTDSAHRRTSGSSSSGASGL
jgi:hypothetical protein